MDRVTQDERFLFDVQGYLHLRGALTPTEVRLYTVWMNEVEKTDLATLHADQTAFRDQQLNRPVSRVIDADVRFACFLNHPAVEPYLSEFLGHDYRHIDNELYYTHPDYKGGPWHSGVQPCSNGYIHDGKFGCPMVKVFFCMTDVGPDEGGFVVIPGSHQRRFEIDMKRIDLPGQHIFDDVKAGDVIIFNEGLLHTGRPNPSTKTRKTIIVNFGRSSAGVWKGYRPAARTLELVTPRQREILDNTNREFWRDPAQAKEMVMA